MKYIIVEIKNILEGINDRIDNTREHISELENRVLKITQAKQKEKKKKKLKDSIGNLWNKIKCSKT